MILDSAGLAARATNKSRRGTQSARATKTDTRMATEFAQQTKIEGPFMPFDNSLG
jgi:hypothetical protein